MPRMIDELRQEISRTRILLRNLPQRLDSSMREHDRILDAFLKNNPELAESIMVKHLHNQMEALRKVLSGDL
jgi:DNA-binding GntR family transcriptional regulator